MTDLSSGATADSPDKSTCMNCGVPIAWDEYCYVHENGWADCGTTIEGGTEIAPGVRVDPQIKCDPQYVGKVATPIEWANKSKDG